MNASAGGLARVVRAVSVPVIFAEITETVVHVTDTAFLARVGTVEVGAIAIADSILEIAIVLTLGLVDGMQILLARRLGQRRKRDAGQVFHLGLALLTGLSLLLTAALLLVSPWVTRLLVGSHEVRAATDAFLGIIAFTIVFNSANMAYSALLVGLARARALIAAAGVLAVVNLVLDYLLVFGKFGLPAMGIRGAALGSLIAEIACCAFLTVYVVRLPGVRGLRLFRQFSWNPRLARVLTRISWPVVLQGTVEAGRWFAFFLILEHIGEGALAASNLVYSCYIVLRIPTEGYAEATCSLVSRLIGAGRSSAIDRLIRTVLSPTYAITLPFVAIAFLFPGFVLSLLTSDPAVVRASESSLRVLAVAMLVVIPGEMWYAALAGTGDTRATFAIEGVLSLVILAGSYLAVLVLGLGIEFVWMSILAAWGVCLALSYLWMRAGYWKRLEI